MPLASLFKRQKAAPSNLTPAAEDDGPVQQARVRARRRLIGAVVLMGVGVVLFPLLFETQPRPLPRDIPIEVARKDAEPATPTPTPPASVKAEASLAERETLEAASPSPAQASAPATTPPPTPPEPAPAAVAQAPEPASAPAPAPSRNPPETKAAASTPKAAASTPKGAAKSASEAVAKAPAAEASAPGPGRFVVQVGAFTDPAAVREARQRLEKLGLKSYTQEIETASGKRTRVRAGPFATREEADRAGARIKAAGLPAYMLAL